MQHSLYTRNERRNRRRAFWLTVLITALLITTLVYLGSPEAQMVVDQWLSGVLGSGPKAEVQP